MTTPPLIIESEFWQRLDTLGADMCGLVEDTLAAIEAGQSWAIKAVLDLALGPVDDAPKSASD